MNRAWLLLFFSLTAHAQPWSGIVAPERAVDWSGAGAVIVNRTTVCATLSPGASASQINSAIAGCPSGQVVSLAAGTYNLTSGITFSGKSNVTLRGAGPHATQLNFSSGGSCFGISTDICVRSSSFSDPSGPTGTANWTGGYTKGTTSITLSNVSGLAVGNLLMLDQQNEAADTGNIWNCSSTGACANAGSSGAGRPTSPRREQLQIVRVTGVSGNQVSFTPGLRMPNWRASQNPGAWWNASKVEGVGIEGLSINNQTSGANGIMFMYADSSWVKNVKSTYGGRSHVWLWICKSITVRDSYFYEGNSHASQSYGVELFMTSDSLVENNILDRITAPLIANGPSSGSVIAYNYVRKTVYANSGWLIPSNTNHATGLNTVLVEGNDGQGWIGDNVHGPGTMITIFRNRFTGTDDDKQEFAQTIPIQPYHFWRYLNVIGNVLGDGSTQTQYECAPATTSSASCGYGNNAIYTLGWSGNGGSVSTGNGALDTKVKSTLMRWGNYDTVNDAVRWAAGEVPSGIGLYANAVPSGQTLPPSFYLAARPVWFGSVAWPAIGPDVTGGNLSGVEGFAHKIPARLCWENSPKTGDVLTFSGDACYQGGTSAPTRPQPPTGITLSELR